MQNMLILGIETSCDETAAAVIEDGVRIVSSVVASQIDIHARYGGIVPEVAARQQLRWMVAAAALPVSERRELAEALSRLGPDHREVIVLRFLLDLSEAECAAALGCRPGTVKSRLSRALGRLRHELEGSHA